MLTSENTSRLTRIGVQSSRHMMVRASNSDSNQEMLPLPVATKEANDEVRTLTNSATRGG